MDRSPQGSVQTKSGDCYTAASLIGVPIGTIARREAAGRVVIA